MTTVANAKANSGSEFTAWYRELAPNEKRTFWACFGGWALDALDVQIFSFAIPAIIAAFAITNADAGLIGTVTLLTSAFGGWFAGILADRFGRVRTLQITVVWFAFFTFLCGFAQSYPQLLVFRALMGLGFGGEWTCGAVLMGEVIRARHRGKAVGTVQIGWGIAAIASTVLFTVLPQDTAWRALFWIGLCPALLVFLVRRFVEDPPVFKAAQERIASGSPRASALEIFSSAMIKTTILTSLLAIGAQGSYYALFTWLPTYLKVERKLSVVGSGGYIAVVIIGSFVGYLVSAHLLDRIGRRANFILFAMCSVVTVTVYTLLPVDDTMMLILGFPWLLCFRHPLRNGALSDREFPDACAWFGAGICPQFRAWHRGVEPHFRRSTECNIAARPVNRRVRRGRAWADHRRSPLASGNEGPRADGGRLRNLT